MISYFRSWEQDQIFNFLNWFILAHFNKISMMISLFCGLFVCSLHFSALPRRYVTYLARLAVGVHLSEVVRALQQFSAKNSCALAAASFSFIWLVTKCRLANALRLTTTFSRKQRYCLIPKDSHKRYLTSNQSFISSMLSSKFRFI